MDGPCRPWLESLSWKCHHTCVSQPWGLSGGMAPGFPKAEEGPPGLRQPMCARLSGHAGKLWGHLCKRQLLSRARKRALGSSAFWPLQPLPAPPSPSSTHLTRPTPCQEGQSKAGAGEGSQVDPGRWAGLRAGAPGSTGPWTAVRPWLRRRAGSPTLLGLNHPNGSHLPWLPGEGTQTPGQACANWQTEALGAGSSQGL